MLAYTNFTLTNPFVTLEIIVWGLFLGLVFGAVGALYNKHYLGGFVRRLLAENATDPSRARTLAELGYKRAFFLKFSLRDGSVLRRCVSCTSECGPQGKKRRYINDPAAAFYVPEELRIRAEIRYEGKGTTPLTLLLSVLVLFVVVALSLIFIPKLLDLLDQFLSSILPPKEEILSLLDLSLTRL